jgi:GTP-binding protein
VIRRLRWKGPVFHVSALTREGLEPLKHAIFKHIQSLRVPAPVEVDPRFDTPATPESTSFTSPSSDRQP